MKTTFYIALGMAFLLIKAGVGLPSHSKAPAVTTVAQIPLPTPTPSDYQVIQEIVLRFHEEDRHVIKKMIDIAYQESGLRWDAHGYNRNGSEDFGVFQINSVHEKRYGTGFETDWRENIKVAYVIYKRQGVAPWVGARVLGYK